jgi:hypothetical protein
MLLGPWSSFTEAEKEIEKNMSKALCTKDDLDIWQP